MLPSCVSRCFRTAGKKHMHLQTWVAGSPATGCQVEVVVSTRLIHLRVGD